MTFRQLRSNSAVESDGNQCLTCLYPNNHNGVKDICARVTNFCENNVKIWDLVLLSYVLYILRYVKHNSLSIHAMNFLVALILVAILYPKFVYRLS